MVKKKESVPMILAGNRDRNKIQSRIQTRDKTGIRPAAFIVALMMPVLLAGCGNNASVQTETESADGLISVAFSEVGAESDWRVANSESMRTTFTTENGYEFYFEDAKGKQENQITTLRSYILQGVDYIVLDPVIETGWDEVLEEAKNAGIPVIVVDRMIDVEDETLYAAWVGSDFQKEGETAVEWLESYLEEQGRSDEEIRILHVMGTLGATSQIGRTVGLENGAAAHVNWEIIAQVQGEYTQAKTYEVVSEFLEETQEIDVIYCENDNSALGAIQALEEAGISYGTDGDVIIISFDATAVGLTACMEGSINLDVECNPLHGPLVEEIIEQLEAGGTPRKLSYVEETYFTPDILTAEFIESRGY
ncbi:MAG: ABC transporter substrate-binding protein [Lachnospiraceae bacterium]|nr:ABC transporter substrate-binding protein [Lachnospiraceae bacterium]